MHIKDALPDGSVVPAGKGAGELPYRLSQYKGEVLTVEPLLSVFEGFDKLKTDQKTKMRYTYPKQYGEKMLQGAEKAVSDLGGKRVELSAQCRVAEFYKKQGYMELNDIHMDEDCPHTWMRKEV